MLREKRHAIVGLAIALCLAVTGCIQSAAITGAAKVANNQWSQLTGAEILALLTTAKQLRPDLNLDLTRDQAEAVSEFLSANGIDNQADLQSTLDAFITDPTSVVIPPGTLELLLGEYENPTPTERTTNQGGGSLVSAMSKVTDGDIAAWTPDEIQILGDKITELNPDDDPMSFSDAQAAALSEFLVDNDVNTLGDWDGVMDQYNADPSSVDIPDGAEELFDNL